MSKICSARIGARPIDGSSSISRRGLDISARAIASICCSPPESVPAICFWRSFRRGNSSNICSMLPGISLSGRVKPPISRFSSTVICWKMRRPSGQSAMPCFTISDAWMRARSLPPKWMLPSRGRSSPATVFSVVDLPAPFAPISVTTSPSSTEKEMPLIA